MDKTLTDAKADLIREQTRPLRFDNDSAEKERQEYNFFIQNLSKPTTQEVNPLNNVFLNQVYNATQSNAQSDTKSNTTSNPQQNQTVPTNL